MSHTNETPNNEACESQWQRAVLEKLAFSALKEQKKARRWGVFFKSLFFIYLFIVLLPFLSLFNLTKKSSESHTALINVNGVLDSESQASADNILQSLNDAYDSKATKGIILRINSPGGSPVQAGIINDEIRRQRKLHPHIPVFAVVEDVCASGGYYVAVATDKIFVNKASIVGSIGVIMEGYGFPEALKKIGIERRVLTAGENKAILDPFLPINPKHQDWVKSLLNQVHEQFKAVVRQGRGARLHENAEIFSGLFWSGEQSIKLGLVDGLGSADYVAREIIKEDNIVDFTHEEDFASKLSKRIGASMGANLWGVFNQNTRWH